MFYPAYAMHIAFRLLYAMVTGASNYGLYQFVDSVNKLFSSSLFQKSSTDDLKLLKKKVSDARR